MRPGGISIQALPLLRDLIHERAGIYFDDDQLELLMDKISQLVAERGLDSILDYYYLLKYDADADREWKNLIDTLSVRETFFWREVDQIRTLAEVLVPKYLDEGAPVRIWSAACATGEEPLTIAIALAEKGILGSDKLEIHGSDVSQHALNVARQGVYRERSMRNLPQTLREKYFLPNGKDAWRVRPDIHQKVHWASINLMSPEAACLANSRFIFCRNVFIYFSPGAIQKAVKAFSDCMPHPGYLFLGAAESLLRVATNFELQEINGAFVYVSSIASGKVEL
jgi:chemotaxis protein methyltransferase CheR